MPFARRSWPLVPLAALLLTTPSSAAPSAPPRGVVDRAVPLAFVARPPADGSRRMRPAPATVPVILRYARPLRATDLAALRSLGATEIEAFPARTALAAPAAGHPRVPASRRLRERLALAELPAASLAAVAALDGVARISLDGPLFAPPPPLDFTAAQVQAKDVWRTPGADGLAIDGHGMTVCDIDSGVDVFHPLLFRADGNGGKPYLAWADSDGDGVFTPGKDAVDLHGDGALSVLRVMNSTTTHIYDDNPLFGSDDPAFDLGFDYLYADVNGSGAREQGPAAGFKESDPTYGEQLFLVDDVNGNGVLDVGEKLVALGSSKVKAIRAKKKVYRRGENLIDLPYDADSLHGTGASGVMVGGTIGLTRLVGMAPGADLVMGVNNGSDGELKLAKFCHDEGARVVLHEYAPWQGYHLDGSSPMEQYIDETMADDTAHINPAGNLSGSDKLYKNELAPGATTDVAITAPEGWGFTFLGASFLWRDPSRALSFVLEDPTGFSMAVPGDTGFLQEPWHDGLTIYAAREDSDRGTSRIDVYLFSNSAAPPPIPAGTWKVHVTDPAAADAAKVTLIGYVQDEISGWGKGIHFPEHTSEEHYIGYPGTADHGMAIAAYTGHGYWDAEPDVRAPYSGRGLRIDGEKILWISAPDDPITSGTRPGVQSLHVVYGGTSGASPHVAGGAALLFAQNPTLTGDDVKEAIRKGALVDDAVLEGGPVPNTDYGHGKLRIYESLYGKAPPGGSAPAISIAPVTVEEGDTAEVKLEVSDPDEDAAGLVLELDGDYDGVFDEELAAPALTVATKSVGTLVSKVRVTDATGRTAAALAVVNVVKKGTLPEPDPEPDPEAVEVGGGGACALPAGGASGSGAWLLGALALIGLGSRRRRPASARW